MHFILLITQEDAFVFLMLEKRMLTRQTPEAWSLGLVELQYM